MTQIVNFSLPNILANRIILHIELNNTISPEILPSKESFRPIEYSQILYSHILLKKKSLCAELYYLVNYSVATWFKYISIMRITQIIYST